MSDVYDDDDDLMMVMCERTLMMTGSITHSQYATNAL
jgi:hypothetical protein